MDESRFYEIHALFRSGSHERALAALRSLEETVLAPHEKMDLMMNEVSWLQELGRFEEAWKRFRTAKKEMPKTSQFRQQSDFKEGELLHVQGKRRQALRIFDRLEKEYAKHKSWPAFREQYEQIQYRRGLILAEMGKYRKALPVLEDGAQCALENRQAYYYYLGAGYVEQKDWEPARDALLRALEIGDVPNFELATRYALGIAYYRLGSHARAKVEFENCEARAEEGQINRKTLFEYLAATCKGLRLDDEAERYRNLAQKQKKASNR